MTSIRRLLVLSTLWLSALTATHAQVVVIVSAKSPVNTLSRQ